MKLAFRTCTFRIFWGDEVSYKRLFIWVEGPDDYEFFSRIIKPLFEQTYDWVEFIQYAERPKAWMNDFFKSIQAMGADYVFVTDLDELPCVTQKLDKVEKIYPFYERQKMQVIVQEIEGWYIAGLSDENYQQLRLKLNHDTSFLTKEQFNQLIPANFSSRRDFMSELLKLFSIATAVQKNNSFRYFAEKYNLVP